MTNIATSKDNILIIEDSVVQAKSLCEMLSTTYNVTCTHTAKDGMAEMQTGKYDLVLLDLILPDKSGFDLLIDAKEDDELKNIPVIVLTGMTEDKSEEKGLTLGAVDYIIKPFNPVVVMARIKVHIRLRKYAVQLEKLTMTDQLTGIGNKRYLDIQSVDTWNRCARSHTAMSICMFDIDYFKAYNDTFGHPEGDKVIAMIATVLKQSFRRCTDVIARYGGEEFLVIQAAGDATKDFEYACKVRQRIEDLHIKHAPEKQPYVTVSMGGVTVFPGRDESVTGFIKISDMMLYRAKQQGRNRVAWTSDRMEEWYEKAPSN